MANADHLEFYKELQEWFEELKAFQEQLYEEKVPHDELEVLRSKLVRSAPRFKRQVIKLVGKQYGEQAGGTFDIWDEALSTDVYNGWNWDNRWSLNALVDLVNEALGVLESGDYPKQTTESQILAERKSSIFIAHGGQSACLSPCDYGWSSYKEYFEGEGQTLERSFEEEVCPR